MTTQHKEKPKHLGRGLQSLLGPIIMPGAGENIPIPIQAAEDNPFKAKQLGAKQQEIELNRILSNPYQPRTTWDQQELQSLADSIKVSGVIQPIVVRPAGNNFELIIGERRFRAAQLASLKTIPALVRKATEKQMLELALIENIHRSNLNPIERAQAYRKYLDTFSLTHAEAAQRFGEDRSVVTNYLRLLELPAEVRQLLADGQLTMGHARAILGLPTDELRQKLANRALAGRLSVREVERLVQQQFNAISRTGQKKAKSPQILELEKQLARQLGTKVTIYAQKNGQKGRIVVEFYSLDEFDRIMEKVGLTTTEET